MHAEHLEPDDDDRADRDHDQDRPPPGVIVLGDRADQPDGGERDQPPDVRVHANSL